MKLFVLEGDSGKEMWWPISEKVHRCGTSMLDCLQDTQILLCTYQCKRFIKKAIDKTCVYYTLTWSIQKYQTECNAAQLYHHYCRLHLIMTYFSRIIRRRQQGNVSVIVVYLWSLMVWLFAKLQLSLLKLYKLIAGYLAHSHLANCTLNCRDRLWKYFVEFNNITLFLLKYVTRAVFQRHLFMYHVVIGNLYPHNMQLLQCTIQTRTCCLIQRFAGRLRDWSRVESYSCIYYWPQQPTSP